jgi:hypothetical protein
MTIGTANTVSLIDLTIKNANNTSTMTSLGGAIFNAGTLTVNNCTFLNNHVTGVATLDGRGGAIYNVGSLTVTNSTFSDNTATGGVAVASPPSPAGGGWEAPFIILETA